MQTLHVKLFLFNCIPSFPESCQTRKQQQKRCAATFLGSQCKWQVAQQELHPPPETEFFAGSTVPSHGTAIKFINGSV